MSTPLLDEVSFSASPTGTKEEHKRLVKRCYARWSSDGTMGRREEGGESGVDVMRRGRECLEYLCGEAVRRGGEEVFGGGGGGKVYSAVPGPGREGEATGPVPSVVAVSHSSFIRVLLSILTGTRLNGWFGQKITNGSITVVDIYR